MANSFLDKLGILLFLICVIDISRGYQRLSIEDDDLCSPITKRNITLGIDDLSALIVSLDNITALKEQEDNKWEDDLICEFQISIPQSDKGVFAVIQNIAFRKNYTTNECIDYVEYRRYDGTLGGKYCGQMGTDYQFQPNDSLVTTNSFVQHSTSLINVYINISKTPLEPDEELELEIVFTTFRNCLKKFSFLDRDSWCWEGFSAHCIARSFSRDGYFNCPYRTCTDEGGCPKFGSKPTITHLGELYKGNLAMSIIAGILCSVFFILCVYRKLRKSCWKQPDVGPVVIENMNYIEMDSIGSVSDEPPPEYHDVVPPEEPPPEYHDVVPSNESPPPYDSLHSE
ncbi:hypothetical protein ILUMI_04276 [Ignelater luminosus]|uniref:Uncharacterized protein n=1 Tax=Ignelater luminosus TaxID=2038154 RepID=A0A8K0GJQ6_IGNLU|nr:hypothetical protein ILUMI_04276 [Ignelater luminosus]